MEKTKFNYKEFDNEIYKKDFLYLLKKIKKDGFNINHKKVYRIYRLLNLERKSKKKKSFIHPSTSPISISFPNKRNRIWSMDFIHDSLSIGKGIRILIIMDIYTRKIVGYRIDRSITGN